MSNRLAREFAGENAVHEWSVAPGGGGGGKPSFGQTRS